MSQQPQCRVCGRWINFGPCACDECLTIIEKQRDDLALYAEQTQTAEARRALGEERILKREALARATAAEAREAGLRSLLREVLTQWRNARACGCEACKELIGRAEAALAATAKGKGEKP